MVNTSMTEKEIKEHTKEKENNRKLEKDERISRGSSKWEEISMRNGK